MINTGWYLSLSALHLLKIMVNKNPDAARDKGAARFTRYVHKSSQNSDSGNCWQLMYSEDN